jgi:fucose permease
VAIAAAAKMLTSHLREVPALPENDIGIKNLIHLFKSNKEIRSGALAFTMFESIEATLSLLIFSLAKDFYGPVSSVPNVIGGVAIYAAMVISRFIASHLQKKGILNAKQTLISSFAALGLGTSMFAAAGISPVGLIGAALAFMGSANTFAPLYNVTSKNNPNKSSEISLIFFTTTTLAALSTTILGAVIDITGSKQIGFIVPFVAILGALYLAKYVFKDMPILKKLNPRNASAKGKKQKTMPQEQQEGPTDFNNPQPQN